MVMRRSMCIFHFLCRKVVLRNHWPTGFIANLCNKPIAVPIVDTILTLRAVSKPCSMKFEVATIKDIAKALNLSTSTVSRALRGSYEISAETKKQVLEYAQKINYHPNPIALSLKERKSRSIGIVVSEIANNFFSQAIAGIESIAYNKGYHVIISQSHESWERERTNIEYMAARGVDGILLSLSSETIDFTYLKELHGKGMPIVFFDRVSEQLHTHTVTANNYQGSLRATEHLIDQGFKKVAHITSTPYLSITQERLKGYKDALQKHHLPSQESLVKYCPHGGMIQSEVENVILELFGSTNRPDAILTAGDRLTITCFGILKRLQLINDLGFVGYTNSQVGELFSPELTVVRQPAFEIGQNAIEYLIHIVESRRPVTSFEHKVLDTDLIIRASSLKPNWNR
jgi:LacI family transcriptional regulator